MLHDVVRLIYADQHFRELTVPIIRVMRLSFSGILDLLAALYTPHSYIHSHNLIFKFCNMGMY